MTALSVYRREFGVTVQVPSWDDLLDGAVRLYWHRRPNITPRCGSDPAYLAHLYRGHTPCGPCRRAHAMVRAIRRLRDHRGVVRHSTRLAPACAGHIGLGFPGGLPHCPWCQQAAQHQQEAA